MTITYGNGQAIKAAVVVRDEKWMRVVLAGCDDVTEFTRVNGTWVSEDCEPVQIDFGPVRRVYREYNEEDYVCSKELAAELIHKLLNPDEQDEKELGTPVPSPSVASAAGRLVV